jgi:hypothetical protein
MVTKSRHPRVADAIAMVEPPLWGPISRTAPASAPPAG